MKLTLPVDAASVGRARRAVADFAARLDVTALSVQLAVSEAVTNAIVHGFRDGGEGEIELAAEVVDGDLVVRVTDNGVGMQPNPRSEGLGMGLSIMGRVADDLRLRAPNGGTEVLLRFSPAG